VSGPSFAGANGSTASGSVTRVTLASS
jgi:hypothetical protein